MIADNRVTGIRPVRVRIRGVEHVVEPDVAQLPPGTATVELAVAGEHSTPHGFPVPLPRVIARDASGAILPFAGEHVNCEHDPAGPGGMYDAMICSPITGGASMTSTEHRQFVERWRSYRAAIVGEPIDHEADTIDFPGALYALREGLHIAREGWNGHGQYVTMQAGYPDGIEINANTAAATGLPQGTVCSFRPYLMLCVGALPIREGEPEGKSPRPQFVPWAPTVSDVLADDWYVLPRPDVTE